MKHRYDVRDISYEAWCECIIELLDTSIQFRYDGESCQAYRDGCSAEEYAQYLTKGKV